MSEEPQFWGLAVERYGQGGRSTNALLESRVSTRGSKPFRFYPVFSSRERADRFVQGQWQTLSQDLIEQTVANIRQIRRDEIPAEHYVSLDGNDPVTWAKLLARGQSPAPCGLFVFSNGISIDIKSLRVLVVRP